MKLDPHLTPLTKSIQSELKQTAEKIQSSCQAQHPHRYKPAGNQRDTARHLATSTETTCRPDYVQYRFAIPGNRVLRNGKRKRLDRWRRIYTHQRTARVYTQLSTPIGSRYGEDIIPLQLAILPFALRYMVAHTTFQQLLRVLPCP